VNVQQRAREALTALVADDTPVGICYRIDMMGHDRQTWPTRAEADAEVDRLVQRTGCARPQVSPIRYA
jgi:hypothetical protein